jgi:exodeoxyribonuclease VII small subunit
MRGSLVAKQKPTDSQTAPTFEEALVELESIVCDLEEGDLGLGDAMARYEQGVKHLRRCYGLLEEAQRKIELLTGVAEDGTPATTPFDDAATMELAEKGKTRSRRRSASVAPETATGGEEEDESGTLF